MQDLMANGNYAPYLAQALTPPIFGAAGMMSGYGGMQGIAPQIGNPGFGNPAFGQFGQGPFGQSTSTIFNPAASFAGQQGFGQQFGQPQQLGQPQQFGQPQQPAAQQQQQIAATLHQLAQHVTTHTAIGQQVGATLHQLAQYCAQQVMAGHQFAQVLNQLAQQCAQAARAGGLGVQSIYGQPFGYGLPNVAMFGQPNAQAWGPNRPLW
jgi:hypothetical protein